MKKNTPIPGAFRPFLLLAWLCSCASLWGQVKLFLPQVYADPGEVIDVPVRVANFSNVKGMQFTLHWDSTHLAFVATGNYNLYSLDSGDFGTARVSSGDLTFAWIDESLNGETLADSSTIFTVTFEVTAQTEVATPVIITDSPTPIEVTDGDEVLPVEIHNGLVLVGTAVRTSEALLEKISGPWPNPCTASCRLEGMLRRPAHLSWQLQDLHGRVLFEKELGSVVNRFSITIESKYLPQAGSYVLVVRAGTQIIAVRKLIFIP